MRSKVRAVESRPDRVIEAYPHRANLYRLTITPHPTTLYKVRVVSQENGKTREEYHFDPIAAGEAVDAEMYLVCWALRRAILAALISCGYKVNHDDIRRPLVTDAPLPTSVGNNKLQIYSAFELRVLHFSQAYYLCLDHHLVERVKLSLADIATKGISMSYLPKQRVLYKHEGGWREGQLISTDVTETRIVLPDGSHIAVPSPSVVPRLANTQIAQLAPVLDVKRTDLDGILKKLSFLTIENAARARLDASNEFAEKIARRAFPIVEEPATVTIDPYPAALRPPHFEVNTDLVEAAIALDHTDHSKRATNTRKGLLRFGAYSKPIADLRLAVLTTHARATEMRALVRHLNARGSYYPGALKVFGSNMVVRHELSCASVDAYEDELRQFVRSDARQDVDVALVYLPKGGDMRDPQRPYSKVKRFLVREGLASQMVDERTVLDPQWSDLNLALNIYAKAGYVPWVLDEAIPNVDLFIGLSSSKPVYASGSLRTMGYANVFDAYGRWRFYQGDTAAFPFDDRLQHLGAIARDSVAAYHAQNGGPLTTVHVHLTKKLWKEERVVIAEAVRDAAPGAAVVFVQINPHHPVRLYDLSREDGQIGRATYLRDGVTRLYLATTGANAYGQRGMGTPIPLELTVWADPPDARPSLSDIAQQVLSLTRLNWASTHSFCQEPITTKFAGAIAQFMSDFIGETGFSVNTSLRSVPWFL